MTRRLAPDLAHTRADIEAAIHALSDAELLSLEEQARFRLYALRPYTTGQTPRDLLNEALLASLDGRRQWRLGIPLHQHLSMAMKSIVANWKASPTPLYLAPRPSPDPSHPLTVQETLDEIHRAFADDPAILALLEALHTGLQGPALPQHLGIPQTEYETRMKRLRRKVRSLIPQEHRHVP